MKEKLNDAGFKKLIASTSNVIKVIQLSVFRSISLAILGLVFTLNFQACQEKDKDILTGSLKSEVIFQDYLLNGNLDIVTEGQATRNTGMPVMENIPIGNFNLLDYEDCFVLNIATGQNGSAVPSAVVIYDGDVLLNPSDFSGSPQHFTFQICDLTEESVLQVELRGNPGSVIDIWVEGKMNSFVDARDGMRYSVIQIGNQLWLGENLAWLPQVNPNGVNSLTDPLYYVYGYSGNDVSVAKSNPNYTSFGVLYNWPAAMTAAPEGWHLPSDNEWKQLEMALGMSEADANALTNRGTNEATQLKATYSWVGSGNGTNSSGFTALAGGIYNSLTGNFFGNGTFANWWTSTQDISPNNAWTRRMTDVSSQVGRSAIPVKSFGFTVRCVRD